MAAWAAKVTRTRDDDKALANSNPEVEVNEPRPPLKRFLGELRRRRVLRVAAVYAAAGWLVLEVTDTVAPLLLLPEWTSTLVLFLVLLGLPVVIALTWVFDVTPEGLRRTESVEVDLGGRADGTDQSSHPGNERRWTARGIAFVGAVAILAIAGAAMLANHNRTLPTVRHRVAVVPFDNRSGEADLNDLGAVAADWIADGLSDIDTVEVLPTATVLKVVEQAGQGDAIPALVRSNRAGLVVTGSYRLVGDSLEMHARVVDAVAGRVLSSADPARAPRSDPTAALSSVRQQVMGHVAAQFDRFGEMRADATPPTYEAYRTFIAGRELFSALRYREAIREFDRARAADPLFFEPLVWTVSALTNLGQLASGDSVLRLVDPHRSRLSEANRLTLDWAHAVLDGDLSAAYRHSLEQFRRAPNDMSRYVAGLFAEETHRYAKAVELMDVAPLEPALRNTWVYYASVLNHALHMLGDHQRELEVARLARRVFPDDAVAIKLEGVALAALGRTAEAEARAQYILSLSPARRIGNRALEIGDVLAVRGHQEAANRVYVHVLTWVRQQRPADQRAAHGTVAAVFRRLDRLDEAAEQAGAARAAAPDDNDALALVGIIAAQQDNRALAERVAADLAARAGAYDQGATEYQRARIRARLGDRDRAVALLRQAHSQGTILSFGAFNDPDLRSLHGYPPFEELLRPKSPMQQHNG